jgi:hypothetical protein
MANTRTTLMVAWLLAPLAAVAQPARADQGVRLAPAAPGTQLMLYVSLPLGGRVPLAPHFGLRFERMQPVSAVPGAPFAMQFRHRLLIDLQLRTGAAPRLGIGERYSLGFKRGLLAIDNADGSPLMR